MNYLQKLESVGFYIDNNPMPYVCRAATEADIAVLEKIMNAKLPEQYVAFLKEIPGIHIGATTKGLLFADGETKIHITSMPSFDDNANEEITDLDYIDVENIRYLAKVSIEKKLEGFMIFGIGLFFDMLLISLREEDYGSIWFRELKTDTMKKLADSFDEFFGKLET